jgi:muramoyltetrapeptide carboxypeptidase LdcA involved in peptidoglycan recycling
MFFDKLSRKLKKLTGKIFFIQNLNKIPKRIEYFQNLDGAVQDELLLIQDFEPNPKKIKEYLASLKLKDIFQEMTWKLY